MSKCHPVRIAVVLVFEFPVRQGRAGDAADNRSRTRNLGAVGGRRDRDGWSGESSRWLFFETKLPRGTCCRVNNY